jgi:hypothetical protein
MLARWLVLGGEGSQNCLSLPADSLLWKERVSLRYGSLKSNGIERSIDLHLAYLPVVHSEQQTKMNTQDCLLSFISSEVCLA